MSISFQLPEAIELHLRAQVGDLNAAAKEAALVEIYRQRKLSQHQLATALGVTRFETDAILKRCGVTEDLVTAEELAEQIATLRAALGEGSQFQNVGVSTVGKKRCLAGMLRGARIRLDNSQGPTGRQFFQPGPSALGSD